MAGPSDLKEAARKSGKVTGTPAGVVETIAGTEVGNKLANSPAAQAVGVVGRNVISGAALPFAAVSDVGAKTLNTASELLGFSNNFFDAGATDRVQNFAATGKFEPSGAKLPTSYGLNPGVQGGSPVAQDPLAAIKAKDAQITNTPTVPTIAGIKPDDVQRPTGQQQTPTSATSAVHVVAGKQLPGGVNQFDFSKKAPAGGVVANGRVSDWSNGSPNAKAIAGNAGMNVQPGTFSSFSTSPGFDANGNALPAKNTELGTLSNRGDLGRSYDEQVAHAKEVNANTMRQMTMLTPKEASELAIANDPTRSRITRSNAAGGARMAESRIAAINNQLKDQQATDIAGLQAKTQNYTDDSKVKAQQIAGDATVKAHEVTALGNVEKAKIAGIEKKQEQSQKDMKGVMDGYIKQWGTLNLPDSVRTNLHEYAKLHAYADANPDKAWIMTQSRDKQNAMIPRVLSVGGKQMDTQAIFKQLESQYGAKEASSRVLGMVQQAGGSVQNIPNWGAFATMKQSENAIPQIAG